MLDQRTTDRTEPPRLPSRTGLALVLFVVVIATAGGVFSWVYSNAHPGKTGMRPISIVELENGFHQLLIDIDQRVL